MNKSNLFKTPILVAAICAGAIVQGQESWSQKMTTSLQSETPQKQASTTVAFEPPLRINKASGLIGLDVKNKEGETLGKIRDVVFDFKNERVAYCVLGINEGILTRDKLLAVPLRAFVSSADGSSLTLNADKEKLARAEGIQPDKWPSAESPSWGAEPFWKEPASESKPAGEMKLQVTPKMDPPAESPPTKHSNDSEDTDKPAKTDND
jgi:sporulation protein YlmC with PRC-barrel domain